MSVGPNPPVQSDLLDATRKKINHLIEEMARLSEMDLVPADYFAGLLKRLVSGLAAAAGAVWVRTEQGNLQMRAQVNLRQVGLEQSETVRQSHNELLRLAFQQGRPLQLPAHSYLTGADATTSVDNPTDYEILLAPIRLDDQVVGLVEAWQSPRSSAGSSWALPFVARLAELASVYTRHLHVRQVASQQHLWLQLETFARQMHGSLNPTEVACIVANEGRRLIECDRVSIGLRQGRRVFIEAVSGTDVVERHSNLVQLMRTLCERVLAWGDRLVYNGTQDESLPPDVLKALDAYLAVSSSKLLVVMPLGDERDRNGEQPARSALLMECFEPTAAPDQLIARMDVVGRHAASALYNAAEYRRIPLPWLWQPLARLQEGLGGKTQALGLLLVLVGALVVSLMVLVPYPLKVDARGQLLPEERRWVYSPVEGQIIRFEEGVQPGGQIAFNQSLVLLYDVQLEIKLVQLTNEIAGAQQAIEALARQESSAATEAERLRFSAEKKEKEFLRDRKILERQALRERTHADDARPGNFWLTSPMAGTLLNGDFQENLVHRSVKPSEPLLRIGDKSKRWEIELKIPQKYIGQVVHAFDDHHPEAELDVDLMVLSSPTRTYKGKLARSKIASQAGPNRDEPGTPEPVLLASVRLDGPGIAESERIPADLLVTGTEVHAKIRCGDHPMGYSLFYGLWEFVNEKVLFFF